MSYPRVVLGLRSEGRGRPRWRVRRGTEDARLDVSRDEAVAVLEEYAGSGGMIYNTREGE
jgi:hypothetical protein